jgi:exonuclease SbcC
MIKSVQIQNFQSHRDTDLEFSPGVNVIAGSTDSGKTAILRAINWVINNRPLGEGFIHTGQKESEVTLIVDGKDSEIGVVRGKGGSLNEYLIVPDNGENLKLESFGTETPQEVTSVLNLSELNVQNQLEPYFLVLDSPGQVALYVRKVTGLDDIDKVVSSLTSNIKTKENEIGSLKKKLEEVSLKLSYLEGLNLEEFERILNQVEKLDQEVSELIEQRDQLLVLISQLNIVDSNLDKIPADLDSILVESEEIALKYGCSLKEYSELKTIIESLDIVEKSLSLIPDDLEVILQEVSCIIGLYETEKSNIIILKNILDSLIFVEEQIKMLVDKEVQLNKEKLECMNLFNICPYCGEFLNLCSKSHLLEMIMEK